MRRNRLLSKSSKSGEDWHDITEIRTTYIKVWNPITESDQLEASLLIG